MCTSETMAEEIRIMETNLKDAKLKYYELLKIENEKKTIK